MTRQRTSNRDAATEVRVKQRKRRLLVAGAGEPPPRAATLSNCGDLLKPLAYRGPPKGRVQHQGNDLGDGNSGRGCDNGKSAAKSYVPGRVCRPRQTKPGYGCSSTTKCQWVPGSDRPPV
jgi:hypothetical protein